MKLTALSTAILAMLAGPLPCAWAAEEPAGTESGAPLAMPPMVQVPGLELEVGKYEVTRSQFAAFVADTGHVTSDDCQTWKGKGLLANGGNWHSPGFSQEDDEPVVCVSWHDANAYAQWLSQRTGERYRLPTDVEWRTACQAGAKHAYCGADDLDAVAWYRGNSLGHTHGVGRKQPNDWGLYDMSGNVYEWTSSCWEGDCGYRVERGGAWISEPEKVRAEFRFQGVPTTRLTFLGFRLVRERE